MSDHSHREVYIMLIYAMILFAASIPCFYVAAALRRGKANLIIEHHQTKVKDKAAYAKAFSLPLFLIAIAMVLSGLFGILDMPNFSMGLLLSGIFAAIIWIIRIQVNFNGGIF